MNKYVIEELKKCKVAQLPPYDNTTRQLIIPKACNVDQYLQPGKCFLIRGRLSLTKSSKSQYCPIKSSISGGLIKM